MPQLRHRLYPHRRGLRRERTGADAQRTHRCHSRLEEQRLHRQAEPLRLKQQRRCRRPMIRRTPQRVSTVQLVATQPAPPLSPPLLAPFVLLAALRLRRPLKLEHGKQERIPEISWRLRVLQALPQRLQYMRGLPPRRVRAAAPPVHRERHRRPRRPSLRRVVDVRQRLTDGRVQSRQPRRPHVKPPRPSVECELRCEVL